MPRLNKSLDVTDMRMSVLLVLTALLAALAQPALSCSFRKQSTETIVDQSSVVFIARIQEVAEIPAAERAKDVDSFENPPVRAKFRVVDTLKGDPSKVQFLRSGYGWGD